MLRRRLSDSLEAAEGFDLLGLESADAGRFFEDHAPLSRRGLEEDVDLALLDDAVGLRSHPRAGEQVANIAETAGLPIDQVLPLAAAIDPPRDVDFGAINRQPAVGVVERDGDLGRVHRPPGAGAVEDHIGHFLAAKALNALLAEDPLDGIDDVRLARSIRPDDRGNPAGKFKPGLPGETFESNQLEGFEHRTRV